MLAGKVEFPNVESLPDGFWRWRHVNPVTEWACKGTGQILVVPAFMDKFELLRQRCGFPLPITSGFRSPEHDAEVGTSAHPGEGPHTTGQACDLAIGNPQVGVVIYHALELSFTGIGLDQKNGHAMLHLDTVHDVLTFWTY